MRALLAVLFVPAACVAPATYAIPASPVTPSTLRSRVAPAAALVLPAVPRDFSPIDPHCQRGAPETCDGIDENCDGAIDEGCGYASGPVQVTAAWETRADVDLAVTDPRGDTVSATRRTVPSGGTLDREARADCGPVTAFAVENVRWDRDPPTGTYRVRVRVYDDCSARTATPVTVSVSTRGRLLGTWRTTLVRTGDAAELGFTLDASPPPPAATAEPTNGARAVMPAAFGSDFAALVPARDR